MRLPVRQPVRLGIFRGLVLWLKFDEGVGLKAYDLSQYRNHGTIYGATWVEGKFGKALQFDGVDDYVEVPDSASLDITDEITVTAWIYPLAVDSYRGIVADAYSGCQNFGWKFGILDGKLWFEHGDGTTCGKYSSVATISTNQWYFVAVTFKDKVRLFVNEEVKEFTPPLSLVSRDAWLGIGRAFLNEYGATYFNGTIDEVRIYNRALSAEEIKRLYWQVIRVMRD